MKKFLFLFLLSTVTIFIACTDESTSDLKVQENLEGLKNLDYPSLWEGVRPQNSARVGDKSVIFNYSTLNELRDSCSIFTKRLVDDLRIDMQSISGCTRAIAQFESYNGKVQIKKFSFINENAGVILQSYTYNSSTNGYDTVYNQTAPNSDLGECPTGWSTLAVCPNFLSATDFASCMGDAQQSFYNTNLNAVGDCAQIQVSIGTTALTMCGRTC
ncbi:hypothetical protein [Flavobacterium rhizosphaerae]|uniref:Lipoprotein n=1 Tax=Flavobacterium rhizosphaerae TaxID=3163298 RepID=A0ABW8YXA6_9FLAO